MAERKIQIEFTPTAEDFLAREGYDPVYGARPLKRAIQQPILDPLAVQVLEGKIVEGNMVVVDADAAQDRIVFFKEGKKIHAARQKKAA